MQWKHLEVVSNKKLVLLLTFSSCVIIFNLIIPENTNIALIHYLCQRTIIIKFQVILIRKYCYDLPDHRNCSLVTTSSCVLLSHIQQLQFSSMSELLNFSSFHQLEDYPSLALLTGDVISMDLMVNVSL